MKLPFWDKYSHTPSSAQEYQEVLELLDSEDESVTALDLIELQHELQEDAAFNADGIRILTPQSLGIALLKSKTESLSLDVSVLLHEELNDFQDEEKALEHFAPLLEYFHTSTALRDLELSKIYVSFPNLPLGIRGRLLARIRAAVAANPNICFFGCHVTALDVSLPVHVLKMSPHVTKLRLYFADDDEHFDDQQSSMILEAFSTNRSLTSLTLSWGERSETVVNSLLHLLPSVNFCLKLLVLQACPTTTMAHLLVLKQLLIASACGNQAIRTIALHEYSFTGSKATESLFSAMIASTCEEFVFISCTMNKGATVQFVQFVKSMETLECNVSRTLSIGSDTVFEDETFGDVLLAGLSGSSLGKLMVLGEAPLELLDGLLTKRSEIALAALGLERVSVLGAEALACFVPHAQPRLCTLLVGTLADGVDHPQLVRAIHQNGSLKDVTIPGINPLYGPLLESVCQRNVCLPQQLNQDVVLDTQHLDDDTPTPVLDVRRLPTLFTSARDGHQTAPNNVLIGLLSAKRAGAELSGLFTKPTKACLEHTARENSRMLHRHWGLCNEIEKRLLHLKLHGQCPLTRFDEIEPPHDDHADREAARAQVMDWYHDVVVQNRQLENEIARQGRWLAELDRCRANSDELVRIISEITKDEALASFSTIYDK